MKTERVFNHESNLSIDDLIQIILNEKIDRIIDSQYDLTKVNTATSKPKGDDVA